MSNFTPTEELLIAVLVARYRLGENSWTFHKRFKRSLEMLEVKGYLSFKSAPIEDHYLAWFTAKGKEEHLSFDYKIPLLKDYVPAEDFHELKLENIKLKKAKKVSP